MRAYVLAVLPVLALAGCGAQPMTPTAVTSPVATPLAQPASKAPEAANSLPAGAQTNATPTSAAGNVNTTRVGPATGPVRRVVPRATPGY